LTIIIICCFSFTTIVFLDRSSHIQSYYTTTTNIMSHDYKFEGWVGHDKDCVNGKLSWEEFKPKTWEEVRNSP